MRMGRKESGLESTIPEENYIFLCVDVVQQVQVAELILAYYNFANDKQEALFR